MIGGQIQRLSLTVMQNIVRNHILQLGDVPIMESDLLPQNMLQLESPLAVSDPSLWAVCAMKVAGEFLQVHKTTVVLVRYEHDALDIIMANRVAYRLAILAICE
jgi:hypothetical protein